MAKITEYPVTTEIANDDVLLVDGAGGTRGLIVAGFAENVAEKVVESYGYNGFKENIDEWLDEHPEATTTVQDGSLTEFKLSDALNKKVIKDYVTPEMFGAVGNGAVDDGEAVQSAFDSGLDVVLLHNYKIGAQLNITKPINVRGGKILADFAGCCIQIQSDSVHIYDLEIDGNAKACQGISISACDDVKIYGCKIHSLASTLQRSAYGIYFINCRNTVISHCTFYDISASQNDKNICAGIESGANVNTLIYKCDFDNIICDVISGAYEADGIHLVHDNRMQTEDARNHDTIISCCIFGSCSKRMIKIQQGGVIVENCLIKENANGNTGIACYYNDIIIRNCVILGHLSNPILIGVFNDVFPNNDAVLKNIDISGCYIVSKGNAYQGGITLANNTLANINLQGNYIVSDGVNEEGISIRTSVNNLRIANNYIYTQGPYAYAIGSTNTNNLKNCKNIAIAGNISQTKVSLLHLTGAAHYSNMSVFGNVLENMRDSRIEDARAKLIVVDGSATTENVVTAANVYPSYFSEI